MESEDCRLARLIVDANIANLKRRKAMWPDVSDATEETIRHSMYLETLDLVRAAWPGAKQ